MVLGFHGTQKLTVDEVVNQRVRHLSPSMQSYDWLGHGVYFWENDPQRAQEWALDKKFANPGILGGVLDLGLCLDLNTRTGCDEVANAYDLLKVRLVRDGQPLPKNSYGPDLLKRVLDCRVIMYLHQLREDANLAPYDSVRAAFPESAPLYEGAGFRERNHIQICIRSPERCIKGYFKPINGAKRAS
jgi:hypothetical protein